MEQKGENVTEMYYDMWVKVISENSFGQILF